jgi:hypothetical protein
VDICCGFSYRVWCRWDVKFSIEVDRSLILEKIECQMPKLKVQGNIESK